MQKQTDFQNLPLKDIVASPTNPRKTFDTSKTIELAESIKEKGVLQPILVREKGKKYEIVCGERRFRASQMVQTQVADRTTIPAIIRALTDQEVREMQLIENFQREDVHPMEEAVAIKYAIETGQYSVEDLMHKVGKSSQYIKQRMKLNALTTQWQQLFFNNRITISLAIQIALFAPDVQLQILADRVDEDELESKSGRMIEINEYQLVAYRGKLSLANFDINDATLLPKAGACSNCLYNTACAGLFPDDELNARCTNITCFQEKTNLFFENELQVAKEIPGIIFVSNYFGRFEDKKLVQSLQADGFDLLDRNAFNKLEKPEQPDWEEWKEDNDYNDMTDDEKVECKEGFDEAVAEWENDCYSYQRSIESGKYKKAFIIEGTDRGKYCYIQLTGKKSANTETPKKLDTTADTVTVEDIDQEIERIRSKEKRSKEIDENKIWDQLKNHYSPFNNVPLLSGDLKQVERRAICQAMYNKLTYTGQRDFVKLFNIKQSRKNYAEVIVIPELDEKTFLSMLRFYMLDVLPPTMLYTGYNADAAVCIEIAQQYFPTVLSDIENTISEKSEKREKKVAQRIAELQAQKKGLKKSEPKKPAKAK
jgi:ParB family chromosome partitioning protein